jgi:prepilin-type N-terminal cleavage/methylation domain-containing protein
LADKLSAGKSRSAGFTLVELLVVISIIAMLMALLLPAVQSARETGRRNTCQNNQHNLHIALAQYNDTKRNFPGWNNWLSASAAGNTNIAAAQYPYAETTYVVPLFPYLEQTVVYNNYTQYLNTLLSGGTPSAQQATALAVSQVYMANLVCPSNPPVSTTGATPLAYMINGGEIDAASTSLPITQAAAPFGSTYGTLTAAQIQGVAVASGIAYDQTTLSNQSIGMMPAVKIPAVRVTQDYVNSHDGTTYTLLLSENTNPSSSWSLLSYDTATAGINAAYGAAVTAPPASATAPIPQQVLTTFMWANSGTAGSTTAPSGYFSINGDKNSTAVDFAHARPASNHNGVCVFAFVGGNVRPINEDIDYRVYKQLMSPNGGATVGATLIGSGDPDSISTVLSDGMY